MNQIKETILSSKLSGDGPSTKRCSSFLEKKLNVSKVLMTTSCTHALEMSAILCNIQTGDEVIAPSYTFVSTVNAFVLRGARVVFVDINPLTMNIDEKKIESAISKKTKAIIVVHYAGVSCEMDEILFLAKKHNLYVIEDAAQAVDSYYNSRPLGAIGDFGTYSFHETKNFTMGEGGALIIKDNNRDFIQRAEIIREKGTDRSRFFRGQVDKYTWVDLGSSYLPSELNVAYLLPQLENSNLVTSKRLSLWNKYYENLQKLVGKIELPFVPLHSKHNAHMFYIKCKDLEERSRLIDFLKTNGVQAVYHYIPLHSSPAGLKFGTFSGLDKFTTRESERLLRLPLFYDLSIENVNYISKLIFDFYK